MTVARELRFALVVDDYDAGARPLADVVETPWGDRNRRFELSGLQLTLFRSA